LWREHPRRIEIGQLHLGAPQPRNHRIERKVRRGKRSGQKIAAHSLREQRRFVHYRLAARGDLVGLALLRLGPERLRRHLTGGRVEVVVDFLDEPAHQCPLPGVAGKERRASPGIGLVQVFDNGVRLVEDEVAINQNRHLMAGIQRNEFRLQRVARRKREHLQLVGKRLVLQRQLHSPRKWRTRSCIQRQCHASAPD
jgi:hypothetical protein